MNVVKQDIENLNYDQKRIRNNLTVRERRALKELSNNKKLTIKPADKGGLIVIQNTEDYHAEVLRQVLDRANYRILKSNPTNQILRIINGVVSTALDERIISEKIAKFLCNKTPTIPVFYTLPKVHKGIFPPPGRPIVAGTDSIFQPLAIFVDKFLQPLVPQARSFIRDTKDFLLKLRDLSLPADVILATLDINSLYTSIPHNEGIVAIKQYLSIAVSPPKLVDFILALLEIVLKKNFFRYGSIFYKQIRVPIWRQQTPIYTCQHLRTIISGQTTIFWPIFFAGFGI
uniref:Reverse transcriptase domain-containing protein n=1 Tax=Leptobrachium leishanense TaxID=445787 RepID=A0A8C5WLI7_9ANUR